MGNQVMGKFQFSAVVWVAVASLTLVACQKISSRQDLEKIQAMEKKADANRENAGMGRALLDEKLLTELGKAYMDWAAQYPDAPETPEFLFRAGELYSNELQDFEMAIKAFEMDYLKYPEHETAPNALFFIGYLYNNSIHDLPKAKQYYHAFLDRYPQHEMAKHAQFELESLGLTPDEVFAKLIAGDSLNMAMGADSVGMHGDSGAPAPQGRGLGSHK